MNQWQSQFNYDSMKRYLGKQLGAEANLFSDPTGQRDLLPLAEKNIGLSDVESTATRELIQSRIDRTLIMLNDQLDLGMDKIDRQLMGLLLNAMMHHTERFDDFAFFGKAAGENSGIHSLQAIAVLHELFSRIGELDFIQDEVRKEAALSLILHDGGEALGEPETLSSADRKGIDKDDAAAKDAEERILRFTLRTAMEAIEQDDFNIFYSRMGRAFNAMHEFDENGLSKGMRLSTEDLDKHLQPDATLSEQSEERVAQWMKRWASVERPMDAFERNPQSLAAFAGMLAKSAEHVQGTRHVKRFSEWDADKVGDSTKADAALAQPRINAKYVEKELSYLFKIADAQTDPNTAAALSEIARYQAAYGYNTIAEVQERFLPVIMDVTYPEAVEEFSPELTERMGFGDYNNTRNVLSAAQDAAYADRSSMVHAYRQAAKRVMNGTWKPSFAEDGKPNYIYFDAEASVFPKSQVSQVLEAARVRLEEDKAQSAA